MDVWEQEVSQYSGNDLWVYRTGGLTATVWNYMGRDEFGFDERQTRFEIKKGEETVVSRRVYGYDRIESGKTEAEREIQRILSEMQLR